MKLLSQEYAQKALEFVKKAEERGFGSDYLARARKLPATITHNGLLVTLSFLYSKAKFDSNDTKPKNADALLLVQLAGFLKGSKLNGKEECFKFLEDLAKKDASEIMLLSKRALLLAQWIKRLAEGKFKEEGGEG